MDNNSNFNYRCPVKMRIYLNDATEEFPAEVWVDGIHNHSLSSAHCLRELRVSEETKAEFHSYFEQGEKGLWAFSILNFFYKQNLNYYAFKHIFII